MAVKKKVKATRKKTSPVKKKTVGRKPAAPRNKPAARPAPEVRASKPAAATASKPPAAAPASKPPVAPSAPAAAAPAPVALPGEERVGIVTHYFGDLSVAAVRIESGSLRVGDKIHIRGHTSDFQQRVDSMQLDHQPVSDAAAGQEIGLRVTQLTREHDVVYKVPRRIS